MSKSQPLLRFEPIDDFDELLSPTLGLPDSQFLSILLPCSQCLLAARLRGEATKKISQKLLGIDKPRVIAQIEPPQIWWTHLTGEFDLVRGSFK